MQSELLSIDHPLEARGLVNEIVIVPNLIKQDQYSSLTNCLTESLGYERGKDLMEFGYDFRQDNRDSARRLAAAVECWDATGPITIIAHSMGCLVARYYLERLGGKSRTGRAIFLGGPHSGTPFAFASLMSGPNLLPMGLMNARLRDLLATYPSWYQILPTYPFLSDQRGQFDVLNDESWLSADRRNLIRQAREFRAELGTTSSVPAVSVFGYGIKTTTAMTVEREALGAFRKPNFTVTTRGDGTIPEFSGVLAGTEIHRVQQHHGSLYADSDVKMRLKLELMRGAASPQ
jgi:pimeloyl-ACP methyl ester carboxylesterase